MKKITSKIIMILFMCFLLFLVYAISSLPKKEGMEVAFLDIGQGDSSLIMLPQGKQLLVDGGPGKTVTHLVGRKLPFWDRTIEYMLLTHPHADHIEGLIEVLKTYEVGAIFEPPDLYTRESPAYQEWKKIIAMKKIHVIHPTTGEKFLIDKNTTMEILAAPTHEMKDVNDTSLVMMIDYQDTEYVFTGDAGTTIEKNIIKQFCARESPCPGIQAEVLKVGHHGSSYSTSEDFLEAVQPTIAIIQVGKGNHYGHPSANVLRYLREKGVTTLRNDLHGTITLFSDGHDIMIQTEKTP